MQVQILKVEQKEIKTKTGQAMTLRICHGYNAEGDTFRFMLPKGHPDIASGKFTVTAEVFVNFDAELATRFVLVPVSRGA